MAGLRQRRLGFRGRIGMGIGMRIESLVGWWSMRMVIKREAMRE
jgi:hypothetical protein